VLEIAMPEAVTWAALFAAAGACVAVIRFWTDLSGRLARAESIAEEAQKRGDEAHKLSEQLHAQLFALNGSFALYREAVAKDYLTRDSLRETETRLTTAIERLGVRIDRALEPKPN